jgi:ectoine hydroxylase-related dioxygenase (phytanoyl-CoA dioxygenase family)
MSMHEGDNTSKTPIESCITLESHAKTTPKIAELEDVSSVTGLAIPRLRKIKKNYESNGYLILKKFFSGNEIEDYSNYYDYLWENRSRVKASIDLIDPRSGHEIKKFEDSTSCDRLGPYKINDLFLNDAKTLSVSLSPKLVTLLSWLTKGIVAQCNSLNFEFGSQQAYHFDTFYMPPPHRAQLIVASICLEDVSDNAGPLSYWPKSHLCRPWINSEGTTHARTTSDYEEAIQNFQDYALMHNLSPKTLLGKSGDVFIWHQQLFHGGHAIKDYTKTRKSLVNHYWCYPHKLLPPNYNENLFCGGLLKRDHKC